MDTLEISYLPEDLKDAIKDAKRRADVLTKKLENREWRPDRAHVEGLRNDLNQLIRAIGSHYIGPQFTHSSEWQSFGSAPEDESVIQVRNFELYRYKLYKPDGARQMKAKGRWQRLNDHGGWENAQAPLGAEWRWPPPSID